MRTDRKSFLKGIILGSLLAGLGAVIFSMRPEPPRPHLRRVLGLSDQTLRWQTHEITEERLLPGIGVLKRISFKDGPAATYAYLLTPLAAKKGIVLLLHGHFSSPEEGIGLSHGKLFSPIGLELVRHGFVVLVPKARYNQTDQKEETRQAMQLLAKGKTLMGERIGDVFRFVDFLSRDHASIGVLGGSMGGITAIYAAALDPRLTAVYASGAFGSVRALVDGPAFQSPDNYIPGILNFGDMDRVVELIRPRPIFIESAKEDISIIFEGARLLGVKVEDAYVRSGNGERFRFLAHSGGHRLTAEGAVKWFERWLK